MLEERLQNIEVRIKYALEHFKPHLRTNTPQHLNPTATLGQIEEFEQKLGCTLPEDYRQFILTIGDGGFGPEFGLNPLINSTSTPNCIATYAFPFRWTEEEVLIEWQELTSHEKLEADIALDLAWEGHHFQYFLVISGAERGNMWAVTIEGENSWPLGDKGMPYSFLDWYELWLDKFFIWKAGHPF